jgi:hypothetical protein
MQQVLPRASFNGRYAVRPWRTLGEVTPAQAGAVAGGAVAITQIALSNAPLSTKIESSIAAGLLSAAPFAGPAAPFLIVGAAAAELLAAFGIGSGCGQTCILSTAYANKAEGVFRQNIDTYFSQPVRFYSAQQAALGVFNAIWNDLVQQCSNAQLGDAGKRCISDRESGSCKWKATADSPWPGGPKMGTCWNWWNAYRDPIANDAGVVPDPVPTSTSDSVLASASGSLSQIGDSISSAFGGVSPLLLIGGALLLFGLAGDKS